MKPKAIFEDSQILLLEKLAGRVVNQAEMTNWDLTNSIEVIKYNQYESRNNYHT